MSAGGREQSRELDHHTITSPAYLRVVLTEDLSPGGTAAGVVNVYDLGDSDWASTGLEVEVTDTRGDQSGEEGSRCYVRLFEDSGLYEVMSVALLKARFIDFTLTSTLTTSGASVSATVDKFWGGPDPDPEDAGIAVYNKSADTNYIFEGASGDKGTAVYDELLKRYQILQMQC